MSKLKQAFYRFALNQRQLEKLLQDEVDKENPDIKRVQFLLDTGASPNIEDWWRRRTLLGRAVTKGNLELVNTLLAAGARVDLPDSYKDLPLHIAAYDGRADIAEALIAAGASPDQRTLESASSKQHGAVVQTWAEALSEAEQFLQKQGIAYTTRPDGMIEAEGNIALHLKNLVTLPDLSNVILKGDFFCNNNRLTSLVGAPAVVQGNFTCHENNLASLAGAPTVVGKTFWCHTGNPDLKHLEGAPQKFGALRSSFGDFRSWDDVPEELKLSPEARQKQQEDHAAWLKAGMPLKEAIRILKPLQLKAKPTA